MFGNVKTFLFDSATVVKIRPGSPFSTKSNEFAQQNQAAYNQIKHLPTRDQNKTVQFWADGIGDIYTARSLECNCLQKILFKQNYSEVRWARNMALLNMAEMDAAIVFAGIRSIITIIQGQRK